MKKFFSLAAIGLLALCANAQTTKEEVSNDINKAGGVYYAYPVADYVSTPAPEGYKPFYISHYGRHGSRYLLSNKEYWQVRDALKKAKNQGKLTPLGEDVLIRVDSVLIEADNRAGDLSPLGVRQHRGIAERMYAKYPEVFGGSPDLTARATIVVRCVLSMDAFCERLKELNPKLNISRDSGQKYMSYLNYKTPETRAARKDKNFTQKWTAFADSLTHPERLTAALFNDVAWANDSIDTKKLMQNLFKYAVGMQNIETKLSFADLFTPDEIFDLWNGENTYLYEECGNAPQWNGMMINNAASLISNIIESADSAIASGKKTADLRFGHDGNFIPLVALMHFKDADLQEADPNKVYQSFADFKIVPMAANMQLVFYRDDKNPDAPVLVKFLHNERETRIPVATDSWPFYKWKDVKDYYSNILNTIK